MCDCLRLLCGRRTVFQVLCHHIIIDGLVPKNLFLMLLLTRWISLLVRCCSTLDSTARQLASMWSWLNNLPWVTNALRCCKRDGHRVLKFTSTMTVWLFCNTIMVWMFLWHFLRLIDRLLSYPGSRWHMWRRCCRLFYATHSWLRFIIDFRRLSVLLDCMIHSLAVCHAMCCMSLGLMANLPLIVW